MNFSEFEALISSSPVVLYARSSEVPSRFYYLSANFKRLFDVDPQPLLAGFNEWRELIHPDDRDNFLGIFAQLQRKCYHLCEYRIRDDRGQCHWIRDESRLISVVEGSAPQIVGSLIDITRQRSSEKILEDSEEKFRAIFETSNDAILLLTERGIIDCNRAALAMFGIGRKDQLLNCHPADLSPPCQPGGLDSLQAATDRIHTALKTGISRFEWVHCRTNGEEFYAEIVLTRLRCDGEVVVQAILRDITERKRAEDALRMANSTLEHRVLQRTEELDRSNRELKAKEERQSRLIGIQREFQRVMDRQEAYELIPVALESLFPGSNGFVAAARHAARRLEIIARWGRDQVVGSGGNQERCPFRMQSESPILELEGQVLSQPCECRQSAHRCFPMIVAGSFVGLLHMGVEKEMDADLEYFAQTLTEIMALSLSNLELNETLREQAARDVLTGLYNRRYLEERLRGELSRLSRQAEPSLCLALIDIDHFKQYNDRFGHRAGDKVLQTVAVVLLRRLRQSDIACRYGGEEFLIVMFDAKVDDAHLSLEMIRQEFQTSEIEHGDQVLPPVTLSIGLAAFPAHGQTVDELIEIADMALYRSKNAGRNRLTLADPIS